MFRKPWFWAVFILVSLLCTIWATANFSRAFPLLSVDVTMDRTAALETAEQLAAERGWGPEDASSAVIYSANDQVQSFVELEAGGKEAYRQMLSGDFYSPYTWVVRRFREGETNETVIRFRPDGSAYGFREKMPEDEPGATLTTEEARILAENEVAMGWDVQLGEFELIEESQEVRPGGRTDHTLVYERPDLKIGEGRYRLRLGVSGDRFTELTHFIKIPEAFSRRYQEMRSANDAIATGSSFAIAILYFAGGCVAGLFFLMRERWVIWKPAVKWAVFIGALQALVVLNQWPLLWMGYDTAISQTTFALQQVGTALGLLLGMGAVLALSFMAAESLSRRAFPHHVQLWRTWSSEVAPTRAILGQTIAGYLLIGIFFAYEVGLYIFSAKYLDWWTPSGQLIDPNVLANIFPWLTSVAISLQAGFWEECLFRAVPIAGAALLGKRFGKAWLWITAAMILQAVIFGAGHANYPAQPAYARLLELIIPALGFGGIFLIFGLLPAIVFHFAFDVVWFAMPLFAADTPGIWVDRGLVIVLTLVPLWVVLRARRSASAWGEVAPEDYNSGWQPPPAVETEAPAKTVVTAGLTVQNRRILAAVGVAGLLLWALTIGFTTEAPKLETGDREAREAARQTLAHAGFEPDATWRELSTAQAPLGLADRFVWTEGGPEVYRDLMGRYLPTPRRMVRYARFDGDVAERAEEYVVYVAPDGSVHRSVHRIPEARPGAALEENDARTIALETVASIYDLSGADIEEVSADSSQLPERRDWSFVFKDTMDFPMATGEARIEVEIAGDEVVAYGRFIHIPEEWERAHRKRQSISQVVQIGCVVLLVLIYLAGAVMAIVRWSRRQFATATFAIFCGLMAIVGAIQIGNGFRSGSAQFNTAISFEIQTMTVLIGGVIATTAIASVVALLIGLAHRWLPQQETTDNRSSLAAGFGVGAILAAVGAIGLMLTPATMPTWPNFNGASATVPIIDVAFSALSSWITSTALFLFLMAAAHVLSDGWRRRRGPVSAGLILFGLVLAGSGGVDSIGMWLLEGFLTGLVLLAIWWFVARYQPALVPLITASGAVLATVRNAVVGAFPGAAAGSMIGGVLVIFCAIWWFQRIGSDTKVTTDTNGEAI